jgi:hypothetical protein
MEVSAWPTAISHKHFWPINPAVHQITAATTIINVSGPATGRAALHITHAAQPVSGRHDAAATPSRRVRI